MTLEYNIAEYGVINKYFSVAQHSIIALVYIYVYIKLYKTNVFPEPIYHYTSLILFFISIIYKVIRNFDLLRILYIYISPYLKPIFNYEKNNIIYTGVFTLFVIANRIFKAMIMNKYKKGMNDINYQTDTKQQKIKSDMKLFLIIQILVLVVLVIFYYNKATRYKPNTFTKLSYLIHNIALEDQKVKELENKMKELEQNNVPINRISSEIIAMLEKHDLTSEQKTLLNNLKVESQQIRNKGIGIELKRFNPNNKQKLDKLKRDLQKLNIQI